MIELSRYFILILSLHEIAKNENYLIFLYFISVTVLSISGSSDLISLTANISPVVSFLHRFTTL